MALLDPPVFSPARVSEFKKSVKLLKSKEIDKKFEGISKCSSDFEFVIYGDGLANLLPIMAHKKVWLNELSDYSPRLVFQGVL